MKTLNKKDLFNKFNQNKKYDLNYVLLNNKSKNLNFTVQDIIELAKKSNISFLNNNINNLLINIINNNHDYKFTKIEILYFFDKLDIKKIDSNNYDLIFYIYEKNDQFNFTSDEFLKLIEKIDFVIDKDVNFLKKLIYSNMYKIFDKNQILQIINRDFRQIEKDYKRNLIEIIRGISINISKKELLNIFKKIEFYEHDDKTGLFLELFSSNRKHCLKNFDFEDQIYIFNKIKFPISLINFAKNEKFISYDYFYNFIKYKNIYSEKLFLKFELLKENKEIENPLTEKKIHKI